MYQRSSSQDQEKMGYRRAEVAEGLIPRGKASVNGKAGTCEWVCYIVSNGRFWEAGIMSQIVVLLDHCPDSNSTNRNLTNRLTG